MSESEKDKKAMPKKLHLTKTVETGPVHHTLGRGRSKTVMVEVKKTRTFSRGTSGKMTESTGPSTEAQPATEEAETNNEALSNLTPGEKEARLRALKEAESEQEKREAEAKAAPPKEEEPKAEEKAEEEKVETEEPKAKEEEPKKEEKAEEAKIQEDIAEKEVKAKESTHHGDDKHKARDKKLELKEEKSKVNIKKQQYGTKRQKSKLTISNAFDQEERVRSMASIKRARQKAKRQSEDGGIGDSAKTVKEVVIPETITVQELANRMAVRSFEVIKELGKLDIIGDANKEIDADTAELIVTELGHVSKRVTDADVEDILKEDEVAEKDLKPRAPIVTIMGHVDHGKTSLLDALRTTNVVDGEAGGITQHIGAYQVKTKNGDITFIDTPGHEAFTSMRSRGTKITDIVILVVAADDGIMPQTIEAINHAKAAEVPMIVAVNKIDKPDANPQKVKDELLAHEIIPEDLGGDTMVVEISATKKQNLDKLLETVLLQAEVLELKASDKQKAVGTVIEATVDKGKGVVVTLLIQRGTLKKGDIVVAGTGFGKIKAITNDTGSQLKLAGPSVPVEVLGLSELPNAGDDFAVVEVEKQAREIIEYRKKFKRDLTEEKTSPADDESALDKLFQTAKDGQKELRLVIKADAQGSVEAIIGNLQKLSNDEVTVKVVHSGSGGITESDATLAAAVGAIVLGFNVRGSNAVKEIADEESVSIRYYSVIYDLIEDMKGAVGGMMSPIIKEVFLGNSEILEVFKMSKVGKVAGCMVTEGTVKRGASVRLIRDNVVIHEGKLKTLKRFKDEVAEVKEGTECGMAFENYEDIKQGDVIEAFDLVEEKRTL